MSFQTSLKIYLENGVELAIPFDASHRVEQEIAPVQEAGAVEVDVNGNAIPLPAIQHRRFTTSISVSDAGAPALADVWPADRITVHSVAKLTQTVPASGEVELIRDPVSGSVQCFNAAGKVVAHTRSGRAITASGARYVRYAPVLAMVVTEHSWSVNEITAESSWSLSAREA